jgi:hypothetical protein
MEIENTISQFRYKRKLEKDRLGTAKKTKERLGLASRQAEDSKNQALQLARSTKEGVRQSYSPEKAISEWMDEYESIREEDYSTSNAATEEEPTRPKIRFEFPQESFNSETSQRIKQGLVERGIPEHVAEGFLWNVRDESGLDLDVEEAEPNVHGTRGKGLYQLTGKRREQFEERYGNDYSLDNQLDFFVWEINNSEKAAGEKILNSENASEAAVSIVQDFLRPAKKHRERRTARYRAYGDQQ